MTKEVSPASLGIFTCLCYRSKFRLKFFNLQYSSQIIETDTVSLEFSGKILRFTLQTVFLTEMCLPPPQC